MDIFRTEVTTSRRARLRLAAAALALPMALVIGAGGMLPARAQAATAPDGFVEGLTKEILDKIRGDKEIQDGNPRRISDFVDATIMPHVNFERMTSLAVGRGWRQASPEQQKRLMSEFRVVLLRTYSGALAAVKDQTVRMRPFRGSASDPEVVVRSEIVQPRGEPVQLDYRLEKAGDAWKIYDVNVLGVWLVETYRNQFAQEINAHGVDGLIRSLSDKNKSFEEAAKKS